MEYKLIKSVSCEDLINEVNISLNNDWNLYGPATVVYIDTCILYFQAMVKAVK